MLYVRAESCDESISSPAEWLHLFLTSGRQCTDCRTLWLVCHALRRLYVLTVRTVTHGILGEAQLSSSALGEHQGTFFGFRVHLRQCTLL